MQFSISVMRMDPDVALAVAAKADELGYDSLWIPYHLIVPERIDSRYLYSEDGAPPAWFRETPWQDPWIGLAYLAAVTKRIRLGTNVFILPLRNPFATARALATLDRLSGGRVILGIGVGWMREEFDVVGEAFEGRGSRTDEIIDILRRLWTEPSVEHQGEYYAFPAVRFRPTLPQPVPVHVGGESGVALRRAARNDGWISVTLAPDKLAQPVARLRDLRRELGRESAPFEITCGMRLPVTVENIRRYEEAGVTRLNVTPWGFGEASGAQQAIDALERQWHEVLSKV